MNLAIGLLHRPNRMFGVLAVISGVIMVTALAVRELRIALAQNSVPASCNQILPEVQKRLASCGNMARDQVCYGNPAVVVTLAESATPIPFTKPGDSVDLRLIKSIRTAPLNLERNEWGIAALKVQVINLDGTSTGQTATFALFGDTSLVNATKAGDQPAVQPPPLACSASVSRVSNLRNAPVNGSQSVKVLSAGTPLNISGRVADGTWLFADTQGQSGWVLSSSVKLNCDAASRPVIDPAAPTQLAGLRAFYFTTGVAAQAQCRDVPQGGFLVRSPSGRKLEFNLEGADISMGSMGEFLKVGNQLILIVQSGEFTISGNDKTVHVRAGQQVSMTVDNNTPPQVNSLDDPKPAQNPPSNALLCALNPVLGAGCNVSRPGNVSVAPVAADPILRPEGSGNTVVGPFPPPTAGPSGPSGIPACFATGAFCSSNGQCCSGTCYTPICMAFPCPNICA